MYNIIFRLILSFEVQSAITVLNSIISIKVIEGYIYEIFLIQWNKIIDHHNSIFPPLYLKVRWISNTGIFLPRITKICFLCILTTCTFFKKENSFSCSTNVDSFFVSNVITGIVEYLHFRTTFLKKCWWYYLDMKVQYLEIYKIKIDYNLANSI